MSKLEIEFYKTNMMSDSDEKNQKIMELYNTRINVLNGKEQKQLALFVKKYLEDNNKWKYRVSKKGKVDKKSERIEKICKILNINLPKKQK